MSRYRITVRGDDVGGTFGGRVELRGYIDGARTSGLAHVLGAHEWTRDLLVIGSPADDDYDPFVREGDDPDPYAQVEKLAAALSDVVNAYVRAAHAQSIQSADLFDAIYRAQQLLAAAS